MDRGCLKISLIGCGLLVGLPIVLLLAAGLGMTVLFNMPAGEPLEPVAVVAGLCPEAAAKRYFETQDDRMEVMLGALGDWEAQESGSLSEIMARLDLTEAKAGRADFVAAAVPACLEAYKAAELEFYDDVLGEVEDLQADAMEGAGRLRVTKTLLWMVRHISPHVERLREAEIALEAEYGWDIDAMRGDLPEAFP